MEITEVIAATNYFFPGNYGIIITGSQRHSRLFKKESDIDIVVLDFLCCNAYSKSKEKDGYRIDFTILPATDIDNVIDNNLYFPNSVLFSMLSEGICLYDPFLIIEPLQEKAKKIFKTLFYESYKEYKKHLIDLHKLNYLFNIPMTQIEKTVVLSDFISCITILETIRLNNWLLKTKQKIRFLKKHAPGFLEKIERLVEKASKNQFEDIIAYISFYLKSFKIDTLPLVQKYYQSVVGISYQNFSFSKFIIEVYPSLLEDDNLKSAFQYFYLSPVKYRHKYKFSINLVFRVFDEDECLQLIKLFKNRIDLIKNRKLHFDHFYEGSENEELKDTLSRLNSIISKEIVKFITLNGDFDKEYSFRIFIKVCYFLKNCFLFNDGDFKSINGFIWHKWLITPVEQHTTDNENLLKQIRIARIKDAEFFYKKNIDLFLKWVLTDDTTLIKKESGLREIFIILENIVNEKEKYSIPEDDLNVIIFSFEKFSDIKSIWLYKQIIESAFLVLNISDNEKMQYLYACSKACIEIGKNTSN